jgi:hypothetical protein
LPIRWGADRTANCVERCRDLRRLRIYPYELGDGHSSIRQAPFFVDASAVEARHYT